VLFRVGFGLLMFWEITRYFYFGWVEELFAKPQFHFQYEYFHWVVPIPGIGMYLIFAGPYDSLRFILPNSNHPVFSWLHLRILA
jgi:hypothetical protein